MRTAHLSALGAVLLKRVGRQAAQRADLFSVGRGGWLQGWSCWSCKGWRRGWRFSAQLHSPPQIELNISASRILNYYSNQAHLALVVGAPLPQRRRTPRQRLHAARIVLRQCGLLLHQIRQALCLRSQLGAARVRSLELSRGRGAGAGKRGDALGGLRLLSALRGQRLAANALKAALGWGLRQLP